MYRFSHIYNERKRRQKLVNQLQHYGDRMKVAQTTIKDHDCDYDVYLTRVNSYWDEFKEPLIGPIVPAPLIGPVAPPTGGDTKTAPTGAAVTAIGETKASLATEYQRQHAETHSKTAKAMREEGRKRCMAMYELCDEWKQQIDKIIGRLEVGEKQLADLKLSEYQVPLNVCTKDSFNNNNRNLVTCY
jgi:hypothetical protein